MRLRPFRWALAALLALAGCLPYSCGRNESRVLFPADSVSRALAAATGVDTLVAMSATPIEGAHPRTLGFDPAGTVFATDTERHRLLRLDPGGRVDEIGLDSLRFPYLAGFRGDHPVVYSPEGRRLVAIDFERRAAVWSQAVPAGDPASLTYAAVDDSTAWIKLLGEGAEGTLIRFDRDGRETARVALPGPAWRYAGLLRTAAGRVMSLSGYLPLIHVPEDGRLDSLALVGFDSPMLARSRAFVLGRADGPPLLSASAALSDSLLFVLNMRPGWLRVDVYGREGRLQRVLVEPSPAFDRDYLPTDIAVREAGGGAFEIAVTVGAPEAGIRRYRWR